MADPVNRKIEYRTFTTGSSTDPLSCHRSAFEGPILGTINEKIEISDMLTYILWVGASKVSTKFTLSVVLRTCLTKTDIHFIGRA